MTFPRGPVRTHGSTVSKQLGTHQPPRHSGELQLYPPLRANRRLQQLTPRVMPLPSERHPVPPLREAHTAHGRATATGPRVPEAKHTAGGRSRSPPRRGGEGRPAPMAASALIGVDVLYKGKREMFTSMLQKHHHFWLPSRLVHCHGNLL